MQTAMQSTAKTLVSTAGRRITGDVIQARSLSVSAVSKKRIDSQWLREISTIETRGTNEIVHELQPGPCRQEFSRNQVFLKRQPSDEVKVSSTTVNQYRFIGQISAKSGIPLVD